MEADNKKGLSTSFIKTVALICMLIDHFAATIVSGLAMHMTHPAVQALQDFFGDATVMETYNRIAEIYGWMRNIGRISFPIYCFFIVEGFVRTRNRKKYARRLLGCALISEIVFDLAIYGKVIYIYHQNVFFTLLLGLLAVWIIDIYWKRKDWENLKKAALSAVCCLVFFLISELLMTDYSSYGTTAIVLMYIVRKFIEKRVKIWAPIVFATGTAVLCMLGWNEAWAFVALPLFFFYQGKKGWSGKWFFYFFYPVHLALLAVMALLMDLQTPTLF